MDRQEIRKALRALADKAAPHVAKPWDLLRQYAPRPGTGVANSREMDQLVVAQWVVAKLGGAGGARPGAGRPRTGKMESITISLPAKEMAVLRKRAAVEKVSVSAIAREAMAAWVK